MMSKKDKYLLAFAILAPLALIAHFLFVPFLDGDTAEPPEYDLLLSARTYDEPGPDGVAGYRFDMQNKTMQVIAFKDGSEPWARPIATSDLFLFRFEAKTNTLVPIPLDATDVKKRISDTEWIIDIPELETFKLSLKKTAPDGYEYARKVQHRAILLDIFDSRTPIHVIRKGRHSVVIPIDYSRFGDIRFHGWIQKTNSEPEKKIE